MNLILILLILIYGMMLMVNVVLYIKVLKMVDVNIVLLQIVENLFMLILGHVILVIMVIIYLMIN